MRPLPLILAIACTAASPLLSVPLVAADPPAAAAEAADLQAIAIEAYTVLYPLVSMDVSRRQLTGVPPDTMPGRGPANRFVHMRAFPSASFREVVRPNFDTLYSSAWLDLTAGPLIITAPDTAGRFYLLPMLDMWSDVIAAPGKRTTGTGAGRFAVVPPGWTGQLPAGVHRIDATTPRLWVIGRTQTNGPADYAAVHAVQAGYTVTALDGSPAPMPAPEPGVDLHTPPLVQVNGMTGAAYFTYAAELLRHNPPHATDWSVMARMGRLGLTPGKPFAIADQPAAVQAAIDRAPAAALAQMRAKLPTLARVVNGWQMNTDTMGVYGNAYLKRAIVAMVGLGANQPEDAIYPLCVADADGRPTVGEGRYVLHFPKGSLPPAGAFWSLTMYDGEGFQVANPIDRFAIGDRDPLVFNPDGSLDILIQHQRPAEPQVANWLPSPATGAIGLTMRLYAPGPEALDGRWAPPALRRLP